MVSVTDPDGFEFYHRCLSVEDTSEYIVKRQILVPNEMGASVSNLRRILNTGEHRVFQLTMGKTATVKYEH
jgi:PleD family two-component response regulator